MVEMIHALLPEAEVIQNNIFGHESERQSIKSEPENETSKGNGLFNPEVETKDTTESCPEESNVGDSTAIMADGKAWKDSTSVASIAGGHLFSSIWIKNEARYLLQRIREHTRHNTARMSERVVLTGDGFGGIIIKQVWLPSLP